MKIIIHDKIPFFKEKFLDYMEQFFQKHIRYDYVSPSDIEKMVVDIYFKPRGRRCAARVSMHKSRLFRPRIYFYGDELRSLYQYCLEKGYPKRRTLLWVLLHEMAHVVCAYNELPEHMEFLSSNNTLDSEEEEDWCNKVAIDFLREPDVRW